MERKSIIKQLDEFLEISPYFEFIDLKHGYFYTAGSKLSLYRDSSSNWAIVVEVSGYNNKDLSYEIHLNTISNVTSNFSSYNNYLVNSFRIGLTSQEILNSISLSEGDVFINNTTSSVEIKGIEIPFISDKSEYVKYNIQLEEEENDERHIDYVSFLRYVNETQSEVLFASDSEKREQLPSSFKKIFEIENWHQKEWHNLNFKTVGNKPSSYETYQQIAKVLETGDPKFWKPTLKPNSHWSFNMESGAL